MEVKRRKPDIASPSYTRNLISPESKVDYPTLHDARHDHNHAWVKLVPGRSLARGTVFRLVSCPPA